MLKYWGHGTSGEMRASQAMKISVRNSTGASFNALDPGAEVDTAKPAVDGQKLLEARHRLLMALHDWLMMVDTYHGTSIKNICLLGDFLWFPFLVAGYQSSHRQAKGWSGGESRRGWGGSCAGHEPRRGCRRGDREKTFLSFWVKSVSTFPMQLSLLCQEDEDQALGKCEKSRVPTHQAMYDARIKHIIKHIPGHEFSDTICDTIDFFVYVALRQARPPPPPVPQHAEVLSCSVLQVGNFSQVLWRQMKRIFGLPACSPSKAINSFWFLWYAELLENRIDADDGVWKAAPQLKAVSMGAALAGAKPDKFIRALNYTTIVHSSQHRDCFCIHLTKSLRSGCCNSTIGHGR